MAHHDLWGWADLEALAARTSRQIKNSLILAKEQHDRWLVFKGADDDATIASNNRWLVADVTASRLALEKVAEIYTFANDGPVPAQGDRLTAMRDVVFRFVSNALVTEVKQSVRALIDAMVAGDEGFAEFKSMASGDSDAVIAAKLGPPATAVLVMDAKVSLRSANQLFEFSNNNSSFGGQRDRLEDWRILT